MSRRKELKTCARKELKTCAYSPAQFHPHMAKRYCSHACANRASARGRTQAPPEGYVTIDQIAERYGYGYCAVWCMIRRARKLRCTWIGRYCFVRVADV